MRAFKNPNIGLYAIGVGLLVLLVVASVLYVAAQNRQKTADTQTTADVTSEPIASPTLTPTNDVIIPVNSPTPTSSAAASPSVKPTENVIALPDTAKTFLANFYSAYKAQDRTRLEAFFTADKDPDLRDLRTALFHGPDGPTLFASNVVLEHTYDYTILGAAPQDANWVVTVSEKRLSGTGQDIGAFTTLVTLVPAPSGQGTWLIDNYVHAGAGGKYNGFFTQ